MIDCSYTDDQQAGSLDTRNALLLQQDAAVSLHKHNYICRSTVMSNSKSSPAALKLHNWTSPNRVAQRA